MKLSTIATAVAIAHPALAGFHIVSGGGLNFGQAILPSNKYACKWYGQFGKLTSGQINTDFMGFEGNICGAKGLNFYKKGATNGATYVGYINGGDGSVVAECYPNGGKQPNRCGVGIAFSSFYEEYVCYSYLCK